MSAREMVEAVRRDLAPDEDDNRLVPLVARGQAPLGVIAALAAEQHHIIVSDRRSLLVLGARSADEPAAAGFFLSLAQGENLALAQLPALAAAAGLDEAGVHGYEPQPGCQAYPAYLAWLALNGEPAEVVLALVANFAAWGSYCATLAKALREHYGFNDKTCGFFDFFATPAPQLEEQAVTAIQAAIDAGSPLSTAHRYGRLLQSYELMFWNTLAGQVF